MMNIEICNNCNKPFKVVGHEFARSGTTEIGPVDCPHCGHRQSSVATSGWWETYPLTEEETKEYEKGKEAK